MSNFVEVSQKNGKMNIQINTLNKLQCGTGSVKVKIYLSYSSKFLPPICFENRARSSHREDFQKVTTLEFRLDETLRLLIISLFATLPNFIQHSPFINSGEFCQSAFLCQTPCLLIHVHSRQRQREAKAKPQNYLMYMFFYVSVTFIGIYRLRFGSDYSCR